MTFNSGSTATNLGAFPISPCIPKRLKKLNSGFNKTSPDEESSKEHRYLFYLTKCLSNLSFFMFELETHSNDCRFLFHLMKCLIDLSYICFIWRNVFAICHFLCLNWKKTIQMIEGFCFIWWSVWAICLIFVSFD